MQQTVKERPQNNDGLLSLRQCCGEDVGRLAKALPTANVNFQLIKMQTDFEIINGEMRQKNDWNTWVFSCDANTEKTILKQFQQLFFQQLHFISIDKYLSRHNRVFKCGFSIFGIIN